MRNEEIRKWRDCTDPTHLLLGRSRTGPAISEAELNNAEHTVDLLEADCLCLSTLGWGARQRHSDSRQRAAATLRLLIDLAREGLR